MKKIFAKLLWCLCFTVFTVKYVHAQQSKDTSDFFNSEKKGLFGKLMKSISHNADVVVPVKIVDKYKNYKGKIIRKIVISPVGFNQNLNDTAEIRNTFAVHVADALHKNSSYELIQRNLFFKEGEKVLPLLISDNERYLRNLPYLSDALIVVFNVVDSKDSVDVVVLTRDVFSIGGSVNISSTNSAKVELKDENINGSGNRLLAGAFFDKRRNPRIGYAGEYIKRNMGGSFFNWITGFKTYNNEIYTGKKEEKIFYTGFEKPLVNRYTKWTATFLFSYNATANAYLDSLYRQDYRYSFFNTDIWVGYNIGATNRKEQDYGKRLRHIVAVRIFYNDFFKIPEKYVNNYNFRYADINGLLFSYSLYRQNFYQTNFIYGFGRNEDIPKGINATITGGYTNKQGKQRSYYGLDFDATHYSTKGFFTSYTFRSGGFVNKNGFEDVDLLSNIDLFTNLKKLGTFWRNRNFISASFTRQLRPVLNEPLFLESDFGLPYFRNGNIMSDCRSTFKFESVFYNLRKIAGFRLAPFIFSDVSFLKPINQPASKTTGYSALGGGIRTRNENLIFGTIELKGYFFPRVSYDGMKNWKVELSTNLKFKFNSSFIRRPDFVIAN
jgi:hypothetical protein